MQGEDLTTITDARLLRALDWWHGLGELPERTPPDRDLLDPSDIPDLLPYVVLWEQLPRDSNGGRRFRCRLAGTAIVEIHGHEFTGWMMPDFHGAENARIQPEYNWVAETGKPHFAERTLFWQNRDYVRYRRILLPFCHAASGRADEVAFILNVAHFLTDREH